MKTYKGNTPQFEIKKVQTEFPKVKITSSEQAAKFIRQFYGDDLEIFESFFILLMNTANNTVGFAKISQGGVASTVVDIKIVAKYALDSLCSSIILAHNHPSGNKEPSQADRQLTKKMVEGLKLVDVAVLDHIILTETEYTSLADNGLM